MSIRQVILVAGGYEDAGDGVGLQGLGFEFGVELAAEEEGVGRDLDDLDVGGVGGGAGDAEASAGEDGFVLAVGMGQPSSFSEHKRASDEDFTI